jgi:hypothetical protein
MVAAAMVRRVTPAKAGVQSRNLPRKSEPLRFGLSRKARVLSLDASFRWHDNIPSHEIMVAAAMVRCVTLYPTQRVGFSFCGCNFNLKQHVVRVA